MAIFASTTTSGYSDPMKAMNLKALEQRQRDLMQQQAQQQPDAAMMSTIPGGIGHVLGVVGDRMQQGRVEQALASQRDVLAKAMSGYDPAGDAPPPSVIATVDPAMYKDMMQTWAENRRQKAGFAHADQSQQAQFGHQTETAKEAARQAEIARGQGYTHDSAKAAQKVLDDQVAAAEAARVQREAQIDAEQRLANRPASESGKIAQDVQSGKITPEQGEAQISKLSAPSASEMKAGNELQNTHLETQSAISDLKEARDLLGPEGTGIRAGAGAGLAQTGAKWGGDALGLTDDPKLTQRTERYNQLMSAEAITAMAAKLKGASTDYEMKAFVALMNDPNAEPKTKMQALNKMIAKAEAHQALQLDQMKRAKVSVPGGGAAMADPLEGRTANGPNGPLIRRNGAWVPNG